MDPQRLQDAGLPAAKAQALAHTLAALLAAPPDERWPQAARELSRAGLPFAVHEAVYAWCADAWDPATRGPLPAWAPTLQEAAQTNLGQLQAELGLSSYAQLHAWSVREREAFWERMLKALDLPLREPGRGLVDLSEGIERPRWLPGARLNISDACLAGDPAAPAIVSQSPGGELEVLSRGELGERSAWVANGLRDAGFQPGDPIGICGVMDPASVAIYLGIVRAGCAVVSVADSFSPAEIATRLRLAGAKGIFCQDVVLRSGRTFDLYGKVIQSGAPRAIVLPASERLAQPLREGDLEWAEFLSDDEAFETLGCEPDAVTNILFSSGTTGDPKAIPWTHTTPIKCAVDGRLHHDVRRGDVLAWPTNLGWMMGPWLIYAALMNRATIALYGDAPTGRGFGEFVQRAGVTMLGVVPSLVSAWRASGCLDGLDWSRIRCFSSTGECSNPSDMLWLMSRAGYRPVIEYCGGTEIGGGYITGTLVQPAAPATFTTPAMGLDLELHDGEVFLVPPSIGLSTALLNRDHHEVYFAGAPREGLRRHGDAIEALPGGFYRALGRVDDTMNLGGIKVSSAELELAVGDVDGVGSVAAIAVPSEGGGPSRLVLWIEPACGATLNAEALRPALQARIKTRLNPLFKLSEVRVIERLPRTASNKVMRRKLRDLCRSS